MILFEGETGAAKEVMDSVPAISDAANTAEKLTDSVASFNFKSWMTTMIPNIINIGFKVIVVILIWLIGKKVLNMIIRMFEKAAQRHSFDISITRFLSVLIKWIGYFIIICTVLNYLNIGTASLVAMLGTAGLAIGMSLQGSLANFAGSVILLAMKPFGVGDYIISSQGEGTVKIIGLIYTTLITIDNKEVHIPNGTLANSNITNVSASDTRGISIKVGIAYSADLKKAKDILEKMISESGYVVPGTDVNVFVSNLGSSSVDLEGRCTVKSENYWPATWGLTEKIKLLYDDNNIEIPFDQLDVHVK